MMKRSYFGTDGIRANIDDPKLSLKFLMQLGWSIGQSITTDHPHFARVLIGRDTRTSGSMLQSALSAGLMAAGVNVVDLGVLATPAIAYLTKKQAADAGIMISASHNPYHDNGVKLIGPDGFKLDDAHERQIESYLEQPLTYSDRLGGLHQEQGAISQYLDYCQQFFSSSLDLSPYRIVVDCANGAVSSYAPTLFQALGATDLTILHQAPDGYNINTACGATDLRSLQSEVLSQKADLGIALDGDGDRLMMVDHSGAVVDGDVILGILAIHGGAEAVVGTLMSNLGLEQACVQHGIGFERAAVGDRYVLEQLRQRDWKLGGESSGHLINLDYATTGDGLLAALQVLQCMQRQKQSLKALTTVINMRPQVLINVSAKDPARFQSVLAISEAVRLAEKKLGCVGRLLLRASGTESCVRVMVEHDSQRVAQSIAQSIANVVEQNLNVYS